MGLCSSTEQSDQILDSRRWYFGGRHCRKVVFVDDVMSSLSGQYFDLNVVDENYNEKQYYVFLKETAGSPVDPAPAGKTKIEIVYDAGDSAATLAGLFVSALDGLAEPVRSLVETSSPDTVEYQNGFLGKVTDEVYTNAGSLTFSVEAAGFGGFLGSLAEGGSTMSTEVEFIDVTADETGGILVDKIIRTLSASLSAPLVEMTDDNWKALVGKGAGSIYNDGSDDYVGYGTDAVYSSAFSRAAQLTGHPVRLPNSDRSKDITLWKTMPVLSDINFSGSEIQTANLTFDALRDATKPAKVDLWARGDHTKL